MSQTRYSCSLFIINVNNEKNCYKKENLYSQTKKCMSFCRLKEVGHITGFALSGSTYTVITLRIICALMNWVK